MRFNVNPSMDHEDKMRLIVSACYQMIRQMDDWRREPSAKVWAARARVGWLAGWLSLISRDWVKGI